MRDVASRAGVSPSTVSHVLNNTRFVDPQTRQRVEGAIDALGYRPNSLARSLRQRQTHTIGLVVPDNSSPFFAGVARAVEDAGYQAGYSVVLCNSDGSQDKESTYINVLLSKQVDGLILMSLGTNSTAAQIAVDAGVPTVLVDREVGGASVDQILIDNEQGGYQAGQYLARLGHRRIACIAGPDVLSLVTGRLNGFRRALLEANVALPDSQIYYGDFSYESGERGMVALLDRAPDLTALFAANDLMAIGAIKALYRAGRRIPADFSVVGFDDVEQARVMVPALTTIAQPMEQIGAESVRALLDRIHLAAEPPARVLLPTHLIERESAAPPPQTLPGTQ